MPGTEEQQAGSSSAATSGSGSGSGSGSQDIDAEALELMGQGKRHLVVGDPPAAVQCLQEACALLAAKYGEMADECGEAYYQYGCSLLELASMENGVLGNALQGVPDESADSDEEEGDEKKAESTVESADKLEDEDAGPSTEPDTTEDEEEEGEKNEQKEDADDISNFQLAWEMLELARIIIGKQESKDCQLKLSQIHLKLGELGLETEQYAQSIIDFKACLDIQVKFLEPESRLIAGTHYNLGLAYSFDQKFDDSIEHYRQSKQLIEKRLASLEKQVAETQGKGKEKADEKDQLVSPEKEIEELKELLPDIVSKLEDAKEMKVQGVSSDGAGPSSSTSSGFASSSFSSSSSSAPVQQIAVRKADSAPVSDISHLVRRKRKPEESEEDSEASSAAESKRSRQEEGAEKSATSVAVNGAGDAVVNGSGEAKMTNGTTPMNGDMVNGDGKLSPEKPSEIKTKKLTSDGEAGTAMETA